MRQFTLLSILASLMLSACAPSAQAIQTAIAQTQSAGGTSDKLTGPLTWLLEEGSTLDNMIGQGVTYQEFHEQLARVKGAWTVALGAQSPARSIPAEVVEEMNQAFTGWDLALSVWDARLNGQEAPRAPDVGRYADLVTYVGMEELPMVGSGSDSYVDQDKVLRILLFRGVDHFMTVQSKVLEEMP